VRCAGVVVDLVVKATSTAEGAVKRGRKAASAWSQPRPNKAA